MRSDHFGKKSSLNNKLEVPVFRMPFIFTHFLEFLSRQLVSQCCYVSIVQKPLKRSKWSELYDGQQNFIFSVGDQQISPTLQ